MVRIMDHQVQKQENQPLPAFRRDLQLFHGPDDTDGSPTYNLFLRITTMGVAFLVLFPVFYTDATDARNLASRHKRLALTAAGVIAELTIAGLATIGWAFSNPGHLQSICFVLASLNWVSSLLISANLAMRFDGYYRASDLLGVQNLEYPQLAAQNKGTLPTVQDPHSTALLLVKSYYPVLMELDQNEPMHIHETGQVFLKGPWTSYAGRFIEYLASILGKKSCLSSFAI